MLKSAKHTLLANLGAKAIALALALIVWALIAGRERSRVERSLRISVEVSSIPPQVEVKDITPEEVRAVVRGPAGKLESFASEKSLIVIPLAGASRGGTLHFYTEDFLTIPAGLELVSLHPRHIDILLQELASREVPVQPMLTGRLPSGFRMKAIHCSPEKIVIMGYPEWIAGISGIATEEIRLDSITRSQTIRVALKKPANVMKFPGHREVAVVVEIESATGGEK